MANIFSKFPKTFWTANTIELIERFAWYGFFMLFANYLTQSTEMGALGFSQVEKGWIMGVGTGILYFLPLITGSIADKYGYKNVLILAFIIYASAFILLPMFTSFVGVFVMYLYLALGAALFKPIISATIAKTTTPETSSIGFGIFYMMVNLGAFFGPMVTMAFRGSSYDLVFYISAGIISLNFIMLFFYNEPEREHKKETFKESISTIFKNIYTALSDVKFVIFLLLVAGFWTMYNQLFFTLPVFITQWVDTSVVYEFLHGVSPWITDTYGHAGQMEAEFITNFDAMFIIMFQLVVSTLVMRWKPLNTMMSGFLVCAMGMALTLFTQNVMFTIGAIFIFAVGEMAGSPKITEYIGRIAPKDKLALYMGCSFIPVFIGNVGAGVISGNVYGMMSDKAVLVKRALAEKGFEVADGLTKNEVFAKASDLMNMSERDLTNYLWDTYNPSKIWMVIFGIGLIATVGLYIYDKLLLKKN
jgi:dipeptide/tripeptide permease